MFALVASILLGACTSLPESTTCGVKLWPGGVIPYDYDPAVAGDELVPNTDRFLIRVAMTNWETRSSQTISFIRDPLNPERVIIKNAPPSGVCSSAVGWNPAPGTQEALLGACTVRAHELGHTIGLFHEHQRIDRDQYVTLDPTSSMCRDYDTYKRCVLTDDSGANIVDYDVSATLHYMTSGSPSALTLPDGSAIPWSPQATDNEGRKVIDLYARQKGPWKPFRSLRVSGPGAPSSAIAPGVFAVGAQVFATLGSSGLPQLTVRGTDGAIWRRTSSGALRAPVWQPTWIPLTNAGSFVVDAVPGLGSAGEERLYYILSGSLRVLQQVSGGTWVGHTVAPPTGTSLVQIAVAQRWGRTYVAARVTDNSIWIRELGGSFGWTSLGGGAMGTPAIALRDPEIVHVFVNSPSGSIYQNDKYGSGAWSGWSVTPNGACCAAPHSSPLAVGIGAREVHLMFESTDGTLSHKVFDSLSGAGWSAPQKVAKRVYRASLTGTTGGVDLVGFLPDTAIWLKRLVTRNRFDRDGDGRDDFFAYTQGARRWRTRFANGTPNEDLSSPVDTGNLALVHDLDADARADFTTVWQYSFDWTNLTTAPLTPLSGPTAAYGWLTQWGDPNWADTIVRGDFDGDGRGDIAVFRTLTSTWWLKFTANGPPYETHTDALQWGQSGDVPMSGADVDGDGADDLVVWRPQTATWYSFSVKKRNWIGTPVTFGVPSDMPAVGDFDGDRKTDFATFRPSDGYWRTRFATGLTSSSFHEVTTPFKLVPKDSNGDGVDEYWFVKSGPVWSCADKSVSSDFAFGAPGDQFF